MAIMANYIFVFQFEGTFGAVQFCKMCHSQKSLSKKILNRAHYITLTYDYNNTFNTIYASSLMTKSP